MNPYTILLATLVALTPLQVSAKIVRHCNAMYLWETTGHTIGPKQLSAIHPEFTAAGHCGNRLMANRCRERARAAAQNCFRGQWSKRWQHYGWNQDGTRKSNFNPNPPKACIESASVEKYDLTTRCVTARRDGFDPSAICHLNTNKSNWKKIKIVATQGDIKAALETSVCCLFEEGKHHFLNDRDVHVRLIGETSSTNDPQKKCKSSMPLSSDYKIDCTHVRATMCR